MFNLLICYVGCVFGQLTAIRLINSLQLCLFNIVVQFQVKLLGRLFKNGKFLFDLIELHQFYQFCNSCHVLRYITAIGVIHVLQPGLFDIVVSFLV